MNGFDYIEADNRKILNYGWVNFPLAYVQVATLSVYAYLLSSLLGKVSKVFKGSIIIKQYPVCQKVGHWLPFYKVHAPIRLLLAQSYCLLRKGLSHPRLPLAGLRLPLEVYLSLS